MTALHGGGATDVGRVRTSNQDSLLVTDDLFVVADGVGGHRGGEVASQTAVETIRETYGERSLDGLVEAVKAANRAVWERSNADANLRGMGTTLCAAALVGDGDARTVGIANVGDSRGYLMRQGELQQLTEDHSLVEELVREGRLSREEAEHHPQRSLITRALGLDAEVEVDTWEIDPVDGDRIVLCSDGLTNEVSDERIAAVLRRLADPDEAARELVSLARTAGGRDNITVVVVDVEGDDDAAARASGAIAGEPGHDSRADTRFEVDEPTPRATRADTARPRSRRRLGWRVPVFVVAVVAVVGVAVGAISWYARATYFVGLEGDDVAVFRGRPGGLLWFDPTVETVTNLEDDEVPDEFEDDVESGKSFSSRAAADRFVERMRERAEAIEAARTPQTVPTSTVVPGAATTPTSTP